MRGLKAVSLMLLSVLAGCAQPQAPTSNPSETLLVLGPGEVPIDRSFKMLILRRGTNTDSVMAFFSIKQRPDARLVCAAFLVPPLPIYDGTWAIDLVGDTSRMPFDQRNAVIEPISYGVPVDFQHPNHKARCVAKPVNFEFNAAHAHFELFSKGAPSRVMLGLGPIIN